jgi:hypothetical protein
MRFLLSRDDREREIVKLLDEFCANPGMANTHLKQDVADIFEYLVPSPFTPVPAPLPEEVFGPMFRAVVQLDDKNIFDRALAFVLSSRAFHDAAKTMIQRHGFDWIAPR